MGSYKKKLFIVLLLFLLISCFVCGSANATMQDITYTVDQPTLLKEQQEYLASIFIKKLLAINDSAMIEDFKTYTSREDLWPLFTYVYNQNNSTSYIYCYMVPVNLNLGSLSQYTINTDDDYFEDYYMSYPVSGYQISSSNFGWGSIRFYYIVGNSNTKGYGPYSGSFFIPSSLMFYNNKTVNNFLNGINPSESSIAMIINAIQENTDEQEEQTEEMKKLNNFMSSEEVDEDAYDMPSDNPTQDITEAGINGIFTMFYDKINNWESENITIRIPFANKIFIIPSDLTENIVNSYLPNTTTFGRLFGLIWYYLLGVYIVKDIQKYIDGLQTGEILTKSDTNIKTEML